MQRRSLLSVFRGAVHPADERFHISGKGDLRLDGLQEHGDQHIFPDILLGAACDVVGMRLADERVPQLLFVAHILVSYQRALAVGAVDHPLEDVFGGFQMRESAEIFKVSLMPVSYS